MSQELNKYLVRFGLVLVITVPIIVFVMGETAVKTMLYKICLVVVAWGLAETIWGVGYKKVFGRAETIKYDEKLPILIFRGILYAAIILALTMGL